MNQFKLNKLSKDIGRAFQDGLDIAQTDAMNHFKKSFDNEGFTDEHLDIWKKRKGQIRGLGESVAKGFSSTKKTLTKSGRLKRSFKKWRSGNKRSVFTNVEYAEIHNEGGRGMAWGKHAFNMPKRKFMGNSRRLERFTLAKIEAKINTAIKNA